MALVSALIILRCISKLYKAHQTSLDMTFLLAVFSFRILNYKQLKIEMLHETLSEKSAVKFISVFLKHHLALESKSKLMWELWEFKGVPCTPVTSRTTD